MYLQFGQNLKPKEILFGPNLLAFIEKNKSKNIGLTDMLSAYENGLKNQARNISITEKLNFIHTKIKNKEDIKADLFLKNDLVPEFHNVDEKQNKDISNILIYTLNNNQYLYDNKELFKNIVTRYPSILSNKIPEAVLDNEALILELIEKNLVSPNATQNSYIAPSFNYLIFPESIKNNKKVVIALVNKLKNTPLNDVLINFVGKEMYKDKDFAKLLSNSIITGKNLQMIDMFSKNIREDEDIAFNFVKISGSKALQYLPSSLREDKKFMLKCLKMDKKAFEFVSEKLKNDDDIRVYKY